MTTITTEPQRRPRPTMRELAHEISDVVFDLPRYATAPLYRHWHQRWGATDEELGAAMPGDELIDDVDFLATRAITIDAHPRAVWPRLVQVGCLRAGFYANDLLDNLGHPSADRILPEFQHLDLNQWVPMSPKPTDTTAFRVAGYQENQSLLWQQPASTWCWTLTELPDGKTRLVTRIRIHRARHNPAAALLSVILTEFGDFPMIRRMLLGIRDRAERSHTGDIR